jgi:hypothetical protein
VHIPHRYGKFKKTKRSLIAKGLTTQSDETKSGNQKPLQKQDETTKPNT